MSADTILVLAASAMCWWHWQANRLFASYHVPQVSITKRYDAGGRQIAMCVITDAARASSPDGSLLVELSAPLTHGISLAKPRTDTAL
jgi:hypothetical protein